MIWSHALRFSASFTLVASMTRSSSGCFLIEPTLILSGDTGNGFRSYDMLWSDLSLQCSNVVNKTRRYLSGMKLGLNLELALLPPGHAHNLTDAFFARVNGLFDTAAWLVRMHMRTSCSKVCPFC